MNTQKEAFTLIEVLISIVLMAIMFVYLSSTINSVKVQNSNYLEKSDQVKVEEKIYRLLNLDLAQIIKKPNITHSKGYDLIKFETKNSLYGIINPNVVYLVSKKDTSLIRIESLGSLNLDTKEDISKIFLYADILVKECISFKVSNKGDFIGLLLRAKDLRPMVLKIPTIGN